MSLNNYTTYIPLQFWFVKNPKLPIPYAAYQLYNPDVSSIDFSNEQQIYTSLYEQQIDTSLYEQQKEIMQNIILENNIYNKDN